MDDFDREMLSFDLQADADAYDAEEAERMKAYPNWWCIALGSRDAPPEEYEKSREIMRQFTEFHSHRPIKNIFDLFKSFQIKKGLGRI